MRRSWCTHVCTACRRQPGLLCTWHRSPGTRGGTPSSSLWCGLCCTPTATLPPTCRRRTGVAGSLLGQPRAATSRPQRGWPSHRCTTLHTHHAQGRTPSSGTACPCSRRSSICPRSHRTGASHCPYGSPVTGLASLPPQTAQTSPTLRPLSSAGTLPGSTSQCRHAC